MDELLEALVAGEEQSFRLFTYVNDLSGEVDKLEDGIGGLRWVAVGAAVCLPADYKSIRGVRVEHD